VLVAERGRELYGTLTFLKNQTRSVPAMLDKATVLTTIYTIVDDVIKGSSDSRDGCPVQVQPPSSQIVRW